jgi:hypothetical protein
MPCQREEEATKEMGGGEVGNAIVRKRQSRKSFRPARDSEKGPRKHPGKGERMEQRTEIPVKCLWMGIFICPFWELPTVVLAI